MRLKKSINVKGELLDLSTYPVMGILNVTPDSFYSESRKESDSAIIERSAQILNEGGAIIDVGAQSTSPNSRFISLEEERERLMPALKLIRSLFPDVTLSVDTFYSEIAKEAVEEYGVNIINDISGGEIDKHMFQTVAELKVPYLLTHMRGTPQNMQSQTSYENFIQDIFFFFSKKIAELNFLGVNDIIIDPGFGFSKTVAQNYELMAYLKYFHIFEEPILVGISRKSMIYKLLGTTPEESLNGTSLLNGIALLYGADILRVHDVKEAVECVKIITELSRYEK